MRCLREEAGLPRQEDFAGAQQVQLVGEAFLRTVAGKFGGAKLARGDVQISKPDGGAGGCAGHGREEVIFARLEDVQVGGGSRRDHADDLAPDQFFPGPGCSIWSQMAILKPARSRRAM